LKIRKDIKGEELDLRDGEFLEDLFLSVMFRKEPSKYYTNYRR